MVDVSKAIYAGEWELIERHGWVYLTKYGYGVEIVLSPADAREVWQVLNKWVERNAPNVEADE